LPHRFATIRLTTLEDAARAIATMQVRGAPLIGATAAYGVCLALRADSVRRGARARMCGAPGDASHRHQSQMGAGRDDRGGAQPPAGRAGRRRVSAAPPKSATRTSPSTRPSAPRCRVDRRHRGEEDIGAAGAGAHALQRRLARDRRFRHRAGAGLCGA
jgi:hypothetical protein